jgi:hypothetical protein
MQAAKAVAGMKHTSGQRIKLRQQHQPALTGVSRQHYG